VKIGKSQLKALIKECLVEILAEGLGNNITEAVAAAPRGPRNRDVEPLPGRNQAPSRMPVDPYAGRKRALDETRFTPQHTPPPPPPAVAALTRDPVMAAIFADTAQTTLVEQARGVAAGDMASQAAARVDPTQMFDEAQIDKWNEAAFKPARPSLHGAGLPADFIRELTKGG
jgi:hypothetical protein